MSVGNHTSHVTWDMKMQQWVHQRSHLAAPASLLLTLGLSLYFLTCVVRRHRLHHTNFISLACLSIAHLLVALAAIGLSLTVQLTGMLTTVMSCQVWVSLRATISAVSVVCVCVALYDCRHALADDQPSTVAGLQSLGGLCISALLVTPGLVLLLLEPHSTRPFMPSLLQLGCMPISVRLAASLLVTTLLVPTLAAIATALFTWRSISANERLAVHMHDPTPLIPLPSPQFPSPDNASTQTPTSNQSARETSTAIVTETAAKAGNSSAMQIPRVQLHTSLSNDSNNSNASLSSQASSAGSISSNVSDNNKSNNNNQNKQQPTKPSKGNKTEGVKKHQKKPGKNNDKQKHEKVTRQANQAGEKFLLVDNNSNSMDAMCHSIDNLSDEDEEVRRGLRVLDEVITNAANMSSPSTRLDTDVGESNAAPTSDDNATQQSTSRSVQQNLNAQHVDTDDQHSQQVSNSISRDIGNELVTPDNKSDSTEFVRRTADDSAESSNPEAGSDGDGNQTSTASCGSEDTSEIPASPKYTPHQSPPKSPNKSILRKPTQIRKQQNHVTFSGDVQGDIGGRILRKPTRFARGGKPNKLARTEAVDDINCVPDDDNLPPPPPPLPVTDDLISDARQDEDEGATNDTSATADLVHTQQEGVGQETQHANGTSVMGSEKHASVQKRNSVARTSQSNGNNSNNTLRRDNTTSATASSSRLLPTPNTANHNMVSGNQPMAAAGNNHVTTEQQQQQLDHVSRVHSTLSSLYLLEARRQRQTVALLLISLVLYVLMLLPSHLLDVYLTVEPASFMSQSATQAQLSVVFFWVSLNIGVVCPLIFLAGDRHFSCMCHKRDN